MMIGKDTIRPSTGSMMVPQKSMRNGGLIHKDTVFKPVPKSPSNLNIDVSGPLLPVNEDSTDHNESPMNTMQSENLGEFSTPESKDDD